MENNSQSRTLYLIQIITIVILVLLLIMQALPFFGIMPPGKQPNIQTFPKSHISPPQQQSQASTQALSALFIPSLVLK
jgi:hypothetical protein